MNPDVSYRTAELIFTFIKERFTEEQFKKCRDAGIITCTSYEEFLQIQQKAVEKLSYLEINFISNMVLNMTDRGLVTIKKSTPELMTLDGFIIVDGGIIYTTN